MATSTRPGIAFAVQYLCRCLSGTWPDSDPLRAEWLHATIVKYRLRVRSEYKYLLHYDVDGEDFAWDGRADSNGPDGASSVQLLSESVERCTCPRCTLVSPAGVSLSVLRG